MRCRASAPITRTSPTWSDISRARATSKPFKQAFQKRDWNRVDGRSGTPTTSTTIEVIEALVHRSAKAKKPPKNGSTRPRSNFSLTIENFCKWVKDYLDQRARTTGIIFLVDEVGQFIGGDTHLMLNLQTITEDLGTVCGGRAWVVVTSQEDIDAVLGEMQQTKSHDFSKIQGRFKTRLSLSSANVDEVIQERLLAEAGSEVKD